MDGHAADVAALFEAALRQPEADQVAYVQREAEGNVALRDAVLELLQADAAAPSGFLGGDPPQGSDPGAQLPDEIGGYRVVRVIGAGGMGIVYEAEQQNPRRRVALKIIRDGFCSPQLLRRFRQETHVLGQLRHPGIAQIIEAGSMETGAVTLPFFSMELVEGLPLDQHASGLRREQQVELMARVCDAVQHAHQKGIIHRDLKPANIHVVRQEAVATASGTSSTRTTIDAVGQPKVMDFGIARLTDSDVQVTTIQTNVGQIIGTLGYMSPEQIAGDLEQLDTRCDIYALGVILYKVLTGQLPYDLQGRSIAEAERTVREDDPPLMRTHDASLRGDLETIVGMALEKDPARRYASAAALAEDLRRYLAREPINAHPPSALYQLSRFTSRNRGLVLGAASVFVSLLIGLISTTYFLVDAVRQREIAERERDASQAVQTWYASLLRGINLEELGADLVQQIRSETRAGLTRNEMAASEVDAAMAELNAYLDACNATDLAAAAVELALLDRAEQAIDQEFAEQPEVRANLWLTFGQAFNRITRTDRALAALTAAETAWAEGSEPPNNEVVADLLSARATAYDNQISAEERTSAWNEYVDYCREHFGPDDHRTLNATADLAAARIGDGDEDEAIELLNEALGRHARVADGETKASLNLKRILMHAEVTRGNYDPVEELAAEVAQGYRDVYGEDHPSTINALSDIGYALTRVAQSAAALPYMEEAVERGQRVLGHDHNLTLHYQHRLAAVLRQVSRYDDAIKVFEQVYQGKVERYGKEAWQTQAVQRGIALIYLSQRRYAEALPLFRSALASARLTLGRDHRTTMLIMIEVGRVLSELGRFAEAEQVVREAVALSQARYGEEDHRTITYAEQIAWNVAAQGRLEDAIALQRSLLERTSEILGPKHLRVMIQARDLYYSLMHAGEFDEAETHCRAFLAYARERNSRSAIASTLGDLGAMLLFKGAYPAAREALEESHEIVANAQGTTVSSIKMLRAIALAHLGACAENEPIALEHFQVVADTPERTIARRRPYLLRDHARLLAMMYEACEQPEEAARWRAWTPEDAQRSP